MSVGPITRPLVVNPGVNAAKHQNAAADGVTIDDRAAKVVKALTGITLGKYGEVDDNPAGGMPPWALIQDIYDRFNGRDGVPATPETIASLVKEHKFTPPASYDASLLFGVWDNTEAKPKTDGSTVDVTA